MKSYYVCCASVFLTLALLPISIGFAAKPNPIPALAPGHEAPRVYLDSASKGNMWAAARNQSIEMSKDFGNTCPDIKITVNPQMANYTIMLNHIEVGFSRNNQMQIAAQNGDQMSTAEGGSIAARVKSACIIILTDWNKQPATSAKPATGQ